VEPALKLKSLLIFIQPTLSAWKNADLTAHEKSSGDHRWLNDHRFRNKIGHRVPGTLKAPGRYAYHLRREQVNECEKPQTNVSMKIASRIDTPGFSAKTANVQPAPFGFML
jgi:hypothetical protein